MADKLIQLGAGDYTVRDVVADTTSTVTVPVLTAGSIVQATPTVGDTLTVTGSNATTKATYQWQDSTDGSTGWADITGETAATLDTTGLPAKFYRRGVTGLTQGPVYTAAVEVTAAASFASPLDLGAKLRVWIDFTDTSTLFQDTAGTTPATTVGDPVNRYNDKSGNGSDFWSDGWAQIAAGQVQSGHVVLNGTTIRQVTSAALPGITSNSEAYALIDRGSDIHFALLGRTTRSDSTIGAAQSTSTGSPTGTEIVGTVIYSVGGTDLVTPTKGDIYSAIVAQGAGYTTFAARGFDISGWTTFESPLLLRNSLDAESLQGNARHYIITDELTTGERADLHAWLAAEAV